MQSTKYIFFRVDAHRSIGTGHLKRCLILARFFKEREYNIIFFTKETPSLIVEREIAQKYRHVRLMEGKSEANQIIEMKNKTKSQIVGLITDGDEDVYYSKEFQRNIISEGIKLITITFSPKAHFYSHIIHNQNPLSVFDNYSSESYSKKLFGLDYLVLKNEFLHLKRKKCVENPKKLLISFGGADYNNLTCKSLRIIEKFNETITEIIIVVGQLFEELEELTKLLDNYNIKTKIYKNTEKMPYIMSNVDIALTSGGLTVWELACFGIPNFVISTSERELKAAKYLAENKLIKYVGDVNDDLLDNNLERIFSSSLKEIQSLKKISDRAYKLIDARGTVRLLKEIESIMK